jgi:ribosome-associated protein
MTARKTSRPPARSALVRTITLALEDMKAVNVRVMDVRGVTDIADSMIIASGNSDRHVRSIADRVVERAKQAGFRPFGREGERDGEWVLVDLNDVIVHVMLPRVREFYSLESLWEPPAEVLAAAAKARPARKGAKGAKTARTATKKTAAKSRAGGSAAPRARKTPAKRAPRPAR